jgi:hypothetical protein
MVASPQEDHTMTDATLHYFGYLGAIGLSFLTALFCVGCAYGMRSIWAKWLDDVYKENLRMRTVDQSGKAVVPRQYDEG